MNRNIANNFLTAVSYVLSLPDLNNKLPDPNFLLGYSDGSIMIDSV